jgi:glycosyltransferase involved in cell wall biosynthesis
MKIVRIRHIFYPDIPRDYFYELSARQVERGHEVHVLTWSRQDKRYVEKVTEGFFVHHLIGLNLRIDKILVDYPFVPEMPAVIERLKPDLIHAESHLFFTSLQAARKARLMKIPFVVTVHGVLAQRNRVLNFLQLAYLRTIGQKLWKWADAVVCLTKSDIIEIVGFGCPLKKILLIPNAIDTELFKPSKKRRDNLVVWVGRFVPEKGVEYLIRSAKILIKKLPDTKFLLVGYGSLKDRLLRLASDYGLLFNSMNFVGPLSRQKVAAILGVSTVFAFPSIKEGYPISVLESMAAGVPVVGSFIPGVKDIVEDGISGFLVPPKDFETLATKISILLEDKPTRELFGKNARASVSLNNNWNQVLDKLDSAYEEAILSHS